MRTLVVDDSKAIHGIMVAMMNALGVQKVDCASSGNQALELIEKAHIQYQVIFVDLNMPGMDGMQLIRALETIRFKGGVVILSELDEKIIQLAADVTQTQRVRLISCLSKPITEDKISTVLRKITTLNTTHYSHQSANERSIPIKQLKEALSKRWLIPYYQPKVSNRTGHVCGLEALARICIPHEIDAITAGQFIPAAEKHGLINEVTMRMLDAVLEDSSEIFKEFGNNCQLALNIPPAILNNEALPETLINKITDKGLSPSNILLEVTENSAVDSTVQLETLNRLRIKGFELALDDYGTGYTNIRQLKHLPYNEIKIDRSLIFNIAKDHLSQVVVHSLFEIFDELNVRVVAEGVENLVDLEYLDSLKNPINLQGFIISRPKPASEVCRWHHSWQKIVENKTR